MSGLKPACGVTKMVDDRLGGAAPGSERTLHAAKRAARRAAMRRRSSLPGPLRGMLSGLAVEHLLCMGAYQSASTIAAFASFGDELQTTSLLRAALAAGKRLVLPAVVAGSTDLSLRAVPELGDLVPGTWGIPEPSANCPEVALACIDLIVVPGVAFDLSGRRVGYGGGYYDRIIRAARRLGGRTPALCALAFEAQIFPCVPAGSGDEPLEWLVTDQGSWHLGPCPSRTVAGIDRRGGGGAKP